MVHPLKGETNTSHNAKLKRMTADYGEADKKDMQYAGVNKYKVEGGEEAIGFGADSSRPNSHAARRIRKPAGGNAIATYKRGGRVKHRDSGGAADAIEQADIDQALESKTAQRGGAINRAKGGAAGFALGPSGGKPTKFGDGTKDFPAPVKGGKNPSQSTEPSPTPVDNRARGGRAGGKSKKGGTHVNIMVGGPHGAPGAQGPMPVSAMPTPPMPPPKPPMAGPPPGMPPGGPPGGGLPVVPPGAAPPGAMPPGLAPRPPMMPPRKRGGRIMAKHEDAAADAAQIKSMVKKDSLKPHGSMRAAGGRMTHLTAGAYSGEGRLQKAHQNKRIAPQKV